MTSNHNHITQIEHSVEFVRSGDYITINSVIKQLSHIGYSRDIPGPDRLARNLGAVGVQLQALFNGGLELLCRLWSPLCDGVV